MPYTDTAGDFVDDSPAGDLEDRAAGLISVGLALGDTMTHHPDARDALATGSDACLEVAANLLAGAHAERLVAEILAEQLGPVSDTTREYLLALDLDVLERLAA